MNARYTILDHPADLGIEARGATIAEAFANAAVGLISIILDLSSVDPCETREVKISASDQDQLLVKWLSEILYLYDGQGFVGKEFSIIRLDRTGMVAHVRGELFSEEKHRTRLDVKAVTYHQLLVREDDAGGLIRVYLDI